MNRARELILKMKCRSKGHVWSKVNRGPRGIVYQHCKRCRIGRVDFKLTIEKSESTIQAIDKAMKIFVNALKNMESIKSIDPTKMYVIEVDCTGLNARYMKQKLDATLEVFKHIGIKVIVTSNGTITSIHPEIEKELQQKYEEGYDAARKDAGLPVME